MLKQKYNVCANKSVNKRILILSNQFIIPKWQNISKVCLAQKDMNGHSVREVFKLTEKE